MTTHEKITREVRDLCDAWLTEAEIEATAQAIEAIREGHEYIAAFGAAAIASWLIVANRIPEETGMALVEIYKKRMKESGAFGEEAVGSCALPN